MLFEQEIGDINFDVPDIGNDWNADQTFLSWSDSTVGADTPFVSQTTPFTCAVVSQEMVLHDFGIDASESQLVYTAVSNGWLTENGTSISDMGKLLEHYGVPTHTNHNGDLPSLVNELAHGHKVIVAVDADELWQGVSFWQKLTGLDNVSPNHAIVVSGIDFSDTNNPEVIINDPGLPDGGGTRYPLNHFLEAWNDSNCTYLATDAAPPDMENNPLLGANFNAQSEIYSTPDFWIQITSKIAGHAAAFGTACLFEDIAPEFASDNPEFISTVCSILGILTNELTSTTLDNVVNNQSLNFVSVLETLDNASRNQLFMEI
jgi:hypothetical protein